MDALRSIQCQSFDEQNLKEKCIKWAIHSSTPIHHNYCACKMKTFLDEVISFIKLKYISIAFNGTTHKLTKALIRLFEIRIVDMHLSNNAYIANKTCFYNDYCWKMSETFNRRYTHMQIEIEASYDILFAYPFWSYFIADAHTHTPELIIKYNTIVSMTWQLF